MIQIRCCSRDDKLLESLTALYGSVHVIGMHDIEFLQHSGTQDDGVVIVDLKYNSLPDGLRFTSPVIVLTAVPTFPEAFNVLQLGGRGYGNRQMRQVNLKQVIDNVNNGQIWLPPSIISKLLDVVGQEGNAEDIKSRDKLLGALSKREQEVALYVAQGMSNQEVADKMFVSLRTIKAHLSSIYEKTGFRNRLELGLSLS